jgi:hypothetical protein
VYLPLLGVTSNKLTAREHHDANLPDADGKNICGVTVWAYDVKARPCTAFSSARHPPRSHSKDCAVLTHSPVTQSHVRGHASLCELHS